MVFAVIDGNVATEFGPKLEQTALDEDWVSCKSLFVRQNTHIDSAVSERIK